MLADSSVAVTRGTGASQVMQVHALGLAETLRQTRSLSEDEDANVIVRRTIWASAGNAHSAGSGIETVAKVLSSLVDELEALQHRLSRLHEELLCLDDGNAAELFGGSGPLGQRSHKHRALGASDNAATSSLQAADACRLAASQAQRSASALGHANSVWVELPDPVAVAATLEASAEAVERFCNMEQVLTAQRHAAVARAKAAIEIDPLIRSITRDKDDVQSLRHDGNPQEDSPTHGCSWFGMWARTLHDTLHDVKKSTELADAHTVVWASMRGPVEDLTQQLRRHYFYVPSSCNAPEVLDCIFNAFDKLTEKSARLHEEMSCLDKEDIMECNVSELGDPVPMLLTAASLQKRALDWKSKFVITPDGSTAKSLGVTGKKVSVGPFLEFLEETSAVGDVLDAHIGALMKHREMIVDSLKASAEVSAWTASPVHIDIRSGGA